MQTRTLAISSTALLELSLICGALVFAILELPFLCSTGSVDSDRASAGLNNQIRQLALTANGRELWFQKGLSDVIALDVATHKVKTVFANRDGPVGDWSVSRDGSIVMLANEGRDLQIYRNQEVIVEESINSKGQLLTGVSSNGRAAVRILDGTLARCWDLSTPEPTSFDVALIDRADRLGVDSLGRFFVTANVDCTVRIYDLKSGSCLRLISRDGRYSPSSCFSDDGRWFALNYNVSVAVYRASNWEKVWTLSTGEFEGYHSVAFSPNGKWIALSGMNAGTQIFDATTGERKHEIQSVVGVPRICFSADSDHLYFGGIDGSIFQWSLGDHNFQELIPRSAHQNSTANPFPRGGTSCHLPGGLDDLNPPYMMRPEFNLAGVQRRHQFPGFQRQTRVS